MATATKGTDPALHGRYMAIFGKDGILDQYNVERREEIELLGYSLVAGVDALFLGDPGVGKTWMIELLVKYCLSEQELFTHLLAKDQSADEVLGPRSLKALKEDRIERMTAGFLPDANFAYLDEIFKASPTMLNPLLDLLANRVLKMGGQVKDCGQLITILMSSNELPEREDLQAFRDRIGITKVVEPVRTTDGRRAVTDLQLDYQSNGINTNGLEPLSLEDIQAIRAEALAIPVGDAIRDMMGKAQQKWAEAKHPPSLRRVGQMWRVIKAHAWVAEHPEVNADDLLPCQHMAFNLLDHAQSARAVIMEFASAFTRKGERLKQLLEPVTQEMAELKQQIDASTTKEDETALMESGIKFLRTLRGLKKEAEAQIKEGTGQGQDVSSLEDVLAEITKAHEWVSNALSGEDDEP